MTEEAKIKWLAERLAISLMSQSELMQGVVLLDGRESDRLMLRDDPGYDLWLRAVRRSLQAAKLEAA